MQAFGSFLSSILSFFKGVLGIITFLVFIIVAVAIFSTGWILALPFILLNMIVRKVFGLEKKRNEKLKEVLDKILKELEKINV